MAYPEAYSLYTNLTRGTSDPLPEWGTGPFFFGQLLSLGKTWCDPCRSVVLRHGEMMDIEEKAKEIWLKMTENERVGVRFGLFPHAEMQHAESEGYEGRALAVALMDVAKKHGGMRA